MNILQTINLSYIYSAGTPYEQTALKHINIAVEEGDFVGIIGQTGSGKSTLIQHFNGLLRPTEGKILLDGKNLWDEKENRLKSRLMVGLVFQYPEYQLFEETVYKDIAFGPGNMGLSEQEINLRVKESLEIVGLPKSILEKNPFDLSGGQKRRIALAGILAMRPKILVLDEPTAGLDPLGRKEIMTRIRDYHKNSGRTVILVSHNMDEIAEYTEKTMILNRGTCFCFEETSEVFKRCEELHDLGLRLPAPAQALHELKKRGLPVKTNLYTISEAAAEIATALGKKGREQEC